MEVRTLYKYDRGNGKITVSPNKPDCEYTEMYRLIADEGKILVNGNERTTCVDTHNIDGWEEIENADNVDDVDEENK